MQHGQVNNATASPGLTAATPELHPEISLFPLHFRGNREKCYICQAVVPLRDYGRHTELCIQQQEAKVLHSPRTADPLPGVESHKLTVFLAFQKENLLSALDKTESRASGESRRGFTL